MVIWFKYGSFIDHGHSTESKFSAGVGADSTRFGTSSAFWGMLETSSWRSLLCLGPSCWMMSGRRSLTVLVSGSPLTMKVLFWMEAKASGFLKWRMVLSSLKKLISSTPSGCAPTFLTMVLTILSLPAWIETKVRRSCWPLSPFCAGIPCRQCAHRPFCF